MTMYRIANGKTFTNENDLFDHFCEAVYPFKDYDFELESFLIDEGYSMTDVFYLPASTKNMLEHNFRHKMFLEYKEKAKVK